jgi:hypothetical protein
VNLNGGDKTKLCSDEPLSINVMGGWIYYCTENGVYRIKTDGSRKRQLVVGNTSKAIVDGGRIYYSIVSKDYGAKLYSIKSDGSDRKKIGKDRVYSFNIANGVVYYSNAEDDGKLYSVKTDGTNRKKMCNNPSSAIHIVDGKVFYYDEDSSPIVLYKINPDGTGKKKIRFN